MNHDAASHGTIVIQIRQWRCPAAACVPKRVGQHRNTVRRADQHSSSCPCPSSAYVVRRRSGSGIELSGSCCGRRRGSIMSSGRKCWSVTDKRQERSRDQGALVANRLRAICAGGWTAPSGGVGAVAAHRGPCRVVRWGGLGSVVEKQDEVALDRLVGARARGPGDARGCKTT